MEINWQMLDGLSSRMQPVLELATSLPPAVAAAVLCAPLLLALASRNAISVLGATLLAALSAAAFLHPPEGTGGALFGCTAYVGAVLIALQGFSERREARAAKLLSADVEAMRRDMNDFISALERRARAIDEHHIQRSKADTD